MSKFGSIAGAVAILATTTGIGLAQPAGDRPAIDPVGHDDGFAALRRYPPGSIEIAEAKTSAPLAAPVPAGPAHPAAAAPHTFTAPPRNAIGLPTPGPAGNATGPMHGPGPGVPNIGGVKPNPSIIGGIRPGTPRATPAPLNAKGALSGTQMGHPTTGAATLGGAARPPSALIRPAPPIKH